MRRGLAALLCALALTGCGGAPTAKGSNTPRLTVHADGPLSPALLTQTQLRQVPGLSTITVTNLQQTAVFQDPDPRGPCGAKVPVVSLRDSVGIAMKGDTIRSGAQFVARLAPGTAKRYLDARMDDTRAGCPEYVTRTHQGQRQRVLLVRIVRLHNEFEQALAVVTALKIADSVRAATEIEVRHGDVLARTVIFTSTPMDDATVRGVASLMGRDLAALAR